MAIYCFSSGGYFHGSVWNFAGAAIIVLEVVIGTVIEKDILSRLLYTFFVLALDFFLLAILTIR